MRNTPKNSTRRLHVLIADNDLDTCKLIKETVEEIDGARATICSSFAQVGRLPRSAKFDICVFDVRFADNIHRVDQLLNLACARWPRAILCNVSNFLGDLTSRDQDRAHVMLEKPIFMLQPSILRSKLIEAMHSRDLKASSFPRRDALAKHQSPNISDNSQKLLKLLHVCLKSTELHDKGKKLERFLATFLSAVDGFVVPHDGINLKTRFEELDVAVEIKGLQHHLSFGTFTICECKNWSSPVSWDELAKLREKLSARRCKFGIFVALNGVTSGFREKLRAYLREGVTIALLTKEELAKLETGKSPFDILQAAFYATIKYEGER